MKSENTIIGLKRINVNTMNDFGRIDGEAMTFHQ